MEDHKSIEERVSSYLMNKYPKDTVFVEIGIGRNSTCAEELMKSGRRIKASDIKNLTNLPVPFQQDDIFEPDMNWYSGADVIYAIRPGIEMVPSLIQIARTVEAELIVYHLGDEIYMNGGITEDFEGIRIHKY